MKVTRVLFLWSDEAMKGNMISLSMVRATGPGSKTGLWVDGKQASGKLRGKFICLFGTMWPQRNFVLNKLEQIAI